MTYINMSVMIMLNINLNAHVNIQLVGADMNEIQNVVQSDDVAYLMKNPITFIAYLELNDPNFMTQLFEHLDKDDIEGFKKNVLEGYRFTNEMYVNYLAQVFDVHSTQITFAVDEVF